MNGNRLLAGAVAGFTATIPMTVVMLTLHRRALRAHQRYPLPPRRITMRAAGKARVRHRMDEPDRTAATYAAHFGYGTATGAVYGALAPRVPGNALVKGTSYGLLVWALSYLGLLPLLDLHRPATREPARRNALMIAAHVVWGAALGALTHQINRPRAGGAPRAGEARRAGEAPRAGEARRAADRRRLRAVGAR